MVAEDNNDFSFPIIATKPVSNFTIPSTSLWRISSLVYPDCYSEGEDDHDQKGSSRSEGSSEFSSRKSSSSDDHVDAEERMDMLWEDLNEETTKMVSCCSLLDNNCKKDDHERGSRTSRSGIEYFDDYVYDLDGVRASGEMEMVMKEDKEEEEEEEELSCEKKGLKISNRTRVMKRPSMVVVLRALKKFFFLQNLARTRN